MSFDSHPWISIRVIIQECWNRSLITHFSACVTLKFDREARKIMGQLFYATSSFAHLFVAVSEFKLELQAETLNLGQIGDFFNPCDLDIWRMTLKKIRTPLWCPVNIVKSLARVTLKFDRRPRKITRHLFYANSSFVPHFIGTRELKLALKSGNTPFSPWELEIWWVSLKNNRTTLLHPSRHCA